MIWSDFSIFPSLEPRVVHIWRANLDHDLQYPSVLSPEETARAERFKFPIHKNRFIAGRSLLRQLLAQYLNQTPNDLQFAYTPHGKPYLPNIPLYFNLSHANEWALYAISLEEKMGIDIEHIHPDKQVIPIAERFFSGYENQLLQQTPTEKKQATFFRLWTCKEAFTKAIGAGLSSFPLENFDVTIEENTIRLLRIHQDEQEARLWSCIELNPMENYAATLVIKMAVEKVMLWEVTH